MHHLRVAHSDDVVATQLKLKIMRVVRAPVLLTVVLPPVNLHDKPVSDQEVNAVPEQGDLRLNRLFEPPQPSLEQALELSLIHISTRSRANR